jgi:hypothetical protein
MYLSLCLIAKDEHTYLKEWLDYHILLGVEHFWIYDNDSTIPLAKSIQSYIDKGWVTMNNIHGKGMQLYAYDHCVRTYGDLSKWIGFIDTDEFITPKNCNNLCEFLVPFEKYAGLAMSTLFFGTGGNQTRPQCGQIAGYLLRTPSSLARNRLIKSIIQPSRVLFPVSPHTFFFSEGNYCVNEFEHRADSQFFPCSVSKIQLNHYYTRSTQEWKEKMSRGRGDAGQVYSNLNWLEVDKNSTVADRSAVDLVISLLNLPPAMAKNTAALTNPLSKKFLESLSAVVDRFQAVPCSAKPDPKIEPREELKNIITDFTDASVFIENKQYQDARNVYAKLIQQFPFDPKIYTDFVIACIHQGDFPASWEALAQAWRLSPRNWTVLTCMVDYFYASGNYEQVEKCSLLLNEFGNLEPLSIAGLALAQWKQGKHEAAMETARLLLPQFTPEMINSHAWFRELSDLMKLPEINTNAEK